MARFISICLLLLGISLFLAPSSAYAHTKTLQDSATVSQILSGINAARVANGLTPYALNPLLTQAAQAHSEYQRDTGQVTHDGPGGTRALNRVQAIGYPAVRANENIYAGMGGPGEAVHWWLGSTAGHVQNILHEAMREIGVGAAPSSDGVTYYTVVFSAQPNVLPIFVNNDAYTTNNATVTLALTNEEIFGSSAGGIGRAAQILISNTPDFANAVSQSWAQYINWTLDTSGGDGLKTVYVRFVDTAGRTADAQDSIVLDTSGGGVVIAPTSLPTLSPQPTEAAPQPVLPTSQLSPVPTFTPTTVTLTLTPGPMQITITPAMRSGRAMVTPTLAPITSPKPSIVLGLPAGSARTILLGTLGFGLACLALGGVDLIRSRHSVPEFLEEEDDATD